MAPNTRCGGFSICHFVHNYTHNLKTKGRIRTFYLSNNWSTIKDNYSVGYSCIRVAIWQIMDPNTHRNHFLIQVLCGCSTYRITALLSEISIFCVRAGGEIRMVSYTSIHESQSLSEKPFLHIHINFYRNFLSLVALLI